MSICLKVDGLEIEVAGENVKYAVEGIWHHCSFDQFVALLDRNFRPTKQEVDWDTPKP
jgi:hypothetical protein